MHHLKVKLNNLLLSMKNLSGEEIFNSISKKNEDEEWECGEIPWDFNVTNGENITSGFDKKNEDDSRLYEFIHIVINMI